MVDLFDLFKFKAFVLHSSIEYFFKNRDFETP